MSTINNILYFSDTMKDSNPDTPAQITALNNAGFNTVVLWALHVCAADPAKNRSLGDLYWNDTPIVTAGPNGPVFDSGTNFTQLSTRLTDLQNGGVTTFLFSIGGWGVGDFPTIGSLLSDSAGQQILYNNLECLVTNLPQINGYDFDDETVPLDPTTITDFTVFLSQKFNCMITYCPYGDSSSVWNQCLVNVYSKLSSQPVNWLNLQCYGGASASAFVTTLQGSASTNGVTNADTYTMSGQSVENMSASDYCQLFSADAGIVGGGFTWNSQFMFQDTDTPTQYATAVVDGLNNNCPNSSNSKK